VLTIIRLSRLKNTNDLGQPISATSRAAFGCPYLAIARLDILAAKVQDDADIILISAGG
jgi:hypothetical protein